MGHFFGSPCSSLVTCANVLRFTSIGMTFVNALPMYCQSVVILFWWVALIDVWLGYGSCGITLVDWNVGGSILMVDWRVLRIVVVPLTMVGRLVQDWQIGPELALYWWIGLASDWCWISDEWWIGGGLSDSQRIGVMLVLDFWCLIDWSWIN